MTKIKIQNRQKGFTLVELLIVVAIIVIIAGVLLLVINPVAIMQKGRDAARVSDMDTINKAIALALAETEVTLTSTTGCATCTSATGTQALDGANGYVQFTINTGKTGLSKYIPALPVDPLNTGSNVYTYASNGTNYELNAVLESADNAGKMSTDGGNAAAVYEVGSALGIL